MGPAAPVPPGSPGVWLRRTAELAAEVEALEAVATGAGGGRVGIAGLLGDLDRQARSAWVPGRYADHGFTWDAEDRATRRWWPQGITSTADASPDEEVAGRRLLVTSWYAHEVGGVGQGCRITVVDLATLRYRHVLLVQAVTRDGGTAFEPLHVHAGGIVWYGPYLHVAATGRGIYSGRLDDLVHLPPHGPAFTAGSAGPVYVSTLTHFGYRYLLPVRFSYRAGAEEGVQRLRYSFLSLDRSAATGPRLLAGEYGRGDQTTRLAGYPLDPATGHLRCDPGDPSRTSRPMLLEDAATSQLQGAVVVDGTWYATASRSAYRPGALYVGRPGAWRQHRWALPFGPEDISYWPSRDTLWSVSEHPHRRWVYAVRRGRFD